MLSNEYIHQSLLETMPHVELARDVGWGQHDAVGCARICGL